MNMQNLQLFLDIEGKCERLSFRFVLLEKHLYIINNFLQINIFTKNKQSSYKIREQKKLNYFEYEY